MTEELRRIAGLEDLAALVGEPLGTSPWFEIDQERLNLFADATLDHQWIHVDPEKAATDSPYGSTIAHGFLTLSMMPHLRDRTYAVDGLTSTINYGLGKVRFPAPVRCGRRIRASFTLKEFEPRGDGSARVTVEAVIEVEGETNPACVADSIVLLIP